MTNKRLTIEIDEELKRLLKVETAKEGITLKKIIERLIKQFLFEVRV
jgi:predicted HicB family RNase H-like nuclease